MIVFPNAKINLGLFVPRKRDDGYHDILTLFYPIPLNDILEVVEFRGEEKSSSIPFTVSGLAIEGNPSSNLCIKAYYLLKKDFPGLPHIRMHLHKVIPSGAGLGGGSSDGAFALQLFNKLFSLGLSRDDLVRYALQLGSDCPFFIINSPCVARGRGEQLEEISLDLSGYNLVLVYPGIHINTGDAFRHLRPADPGISITGIIRQPIERWKDNLYNDFEKTIFPLYPAIVDIKDELYRQGALYASMSGSGSTVFGLFKKGKKPELNFPAEYFVRQLKLN